MKRKEKEKPSPKKPTGGGLPDEMLAAALPEHASPIEMVGDQVARILQIDQLGGGIRIKTPWEGKQADFVASIAKRIIVRAGRRGGKTVAAGIKAGRKFLEGRRVLYAAPTTEQLNTFWNEVVTAFADAIRAGIYVKNESEHYIELKGTKQRIKAKTAWNADTLRGDFADFLILDEFQLMNEKAWGEVGAPMLLDNDGDAVFIYTPPSLHSRSTTKADDPRHASKMYKEILEEMNAAIAEGRVPRRVAFHWTSHDNPTISESALEKVSDDMTQLAYRQEILAEDVTEVPGALWTQKLIDDTRVAMCPQLVRVVVGVDPSGSNTTEAGIVAAGIDAKGHGYVLRDGSLLAPTPKRWAAGAIELYAKFRADRVLGERNYGGDMVQSTIKAVDESVSYKDVNATRGKMVRAEPVCALYQEGKIHHVGVFPELEDEMCSYVPGSKSPNRMDAMVWAFTDLMIGGYALGLIDYLSSGRAQEDMAQMDKVQRAASLAKPMIADQAPKCPECGSHMIIKVPGGLHCNECGIQWVPKEQERPKPTGGRSGLF